MEDQDAELGRWLTELRRRRRCCTINGIWQNEAQSQLAARMGAARVSAARPSVAPSDVTPGAASSCASGHPAGQVLTGVVQRMLLDSGSFLH
eukprot:3567715-Heterocapsa_arctica.AAC.1